MQIVIKYASGLDDRDGFLAGDSDPYTRVTAYTASGQTSSVQTTHDQGDESPEWHHVFNAGCNKQWTKFYFRVYDKDVGRDDALSGGQYVYLSSLSRLPSCRYNVRLVGGGGSITFDIYYYTSSANKGRC